VKENLKNTLTNLLGRELTNNENTCCEYKTSQLYESMLIYAQDSDTLPSSTPSRAQLHPQHHIFGNSPITDFTLDIILLSQTVGIDVGVNSINCSNKTVITG
jgi:hypothetical protein